MPKLLILLILLGLFGSGSDPVAGRTSEPEISELEPDPVLPVERFLEYVEWEDATKYGVFVTSSFYSSRYFDGVDGANERCRDEARNKNYKAYATRAFIFDDNNPLAGWGNPNVDMVRMSDKVKIQSYGKFLQGTISNAIDPSFWETYAMTGVRHGSHPGVSGHCDNWTNTDSNYFNRIIRIDTANNAFRYGRCANSYRLLCFIPIDLFPGRE